ncbi:prepilin-type N-terminal cleavage/methylation domain-containing protein [uncultured Desulfuromonas sp.]|uniref:type IV pilus modification PilV family protein n=1 Tax=uncultured Desulfuromonas sp. TaxID=181013 RepID=UPI002AAB7627|nr:prepilin-type N-terminal cleavage/methylation domain-containing protein [uncultured Desulfuromonas sp.]
MPERIRQDGFSLIEMLIALMILAIGILAVVTMQVTSMRNNALSFSRTEAATASQGIIENLMSRTFNDSLLQDTNGDGNAGLMDIGANADFSLSTTTNNITHQFYWNISKNDPVPNSLTIGLTVQWSFSGTQRSFSMTQIIGQ